MVGRIRLRDLIQQRRTAMSASKPPEEVNRNRRSFLTTGLTVAAAAAAGSWLVRGTSALAQTQDGSGSDPLTAGDVAILRFLAAGEALEADFYTQYNELGGIQDSEVPGGRDNRIYAEALRRIDRNFPQYIHDITDDEMSHQNFLNAYLVSKGAEPVDMEPFRTLQGSSARGSSGRLRLTNLMQLTVDTSWWTRYRSSTNNPDVNPTAFEQAVPDLHNGKFPAIPRDDSDLFPHGHIQAIANTAAYHIPTVEQGGGSLRTALAQRTTSVEVLRLLISMAPIELMHFQAMSKAVGNAPSLTDPTNGLRFPDLNCGVDPNTGAVGNAVREMFQTNLIMPEPCPFISASLPVCSVVRPTNTTGAATGALKFLTAMGLFIGQSPDFFSFMSELATAADAAQREG
jgi:hypothetical protein